MTLRQLFFMILAELQANPEAANRKVQLLSDPLNWRVTDLTPDNINLNCPNPLNWGDSVVTIYLPRQILR